MEPRSGEKLVSEDGQLAGPALRHRGLAPVTLLAVAMGRGRRRAARRTV